MAAPTAVATAAVLAALSAALREAVRATRAAAREAAFVAARRKPLITTLADTDRVTLLRRTSVPLTSPSVTVAVARAVLVLTTRTTTTRRPRRVEVVVVPRTRVVAPATCAARATIVEVTVGARMMWTVAAVGALWLLAADAGSLAPAFPDCTATTPRATAMAVRSVGRRSARIGERVATVRD